jgi:outer membrane protein assembly factor BamB
MQTSFVFCWRRLVRSFLLLLCVVARADDWPQWLGPQRDGIWRETGIAETFPVNGPTTRWRAPIGAGRVYVTDRPPAKEGRAGNVFERSQIPGHERVLCLNEKDGTLAWQYDYDCPYSVSYPAGPRATPVVAAGKVYTLGTEGNLLCFDAANGEVLWQRNLKIDFATKTPLWGFSAHPLLDGNKLICVVGGEGSVAVAFDKDTGKELWRALTAKEPGYCPPMIYEAGGKRQLIIWHPESLNSLDPESGKIYWSHPFVVRFGLCIPTPRKLGDDLFITAFYDGPRLFRFDHEKPAATLVWQGKKSSERDTDGLHSIMSTPFMEGGYIYGVCSYGQLRCLKAETGERLWETFAATTGGKEVRWANAFLVKQGDRFNEKGDLIIAKLSPRGYQEISRVNLLKPTNSDPGRDVLWSHPAFANRSVYARNDKEIICVSLAVGK